MSKFSYDQYQNIVAKAQSSTPTVSSVKVGFFKLKNDGDEAFIRINVGSLDDLQFATVHQLGAAQRWMKISCLNEVGSYSDNCPLCKKVADGDTTIGKASKKVYVQLLVAYRDTATGGLQKEQPVIWERPAGFSREIATLLRDYDGDLRKHVFKVTRNGAAGSKQTAYSISYIPNFDKLEVVSNDFSAFTNFNIAKHSYWEKTIEEIEAFLETGEFPERAKKDDGMTTDAQGIKTNEAARNLVTPAEDAVFEADLNPNPFANATPAPVVGHTAIGTNNVEAHTAIGTVDSANATATTPTAEEKPVEKARNFNGFAF